MHLRIRRWLAGVAAGSLVAGLLVAVGIGAQQAVANVFTPGVEIAPAEPYLAGEDLEVTLTFSSAEGAADQFNLSAGVLIPTDITVVDSGTLGQPHIFAPGDRVPRVDGSADCAALGLTAGPGTDCTVPDGQQYLVFQNISDLPSGADASHTLTLRPKADSFPVRSTDLNIQVAAFTNTQARFLPTFPGSTGSADGLGSTSQPGIADENVEVKALRITKREQSAENELLRGVYDHTTTYTLRVYHTGEGDIANAEVVDFLPAGLEYLGLGGTDNTRDDAREYDGAPSLTGTPAPDPAPSWDQSAGIPLFENTMDFGYSADTVGEQTANLDNNTGPSTRHGDIENGAPAQELTNAAGARGTYAGQTTEDETTYTVEAVDVRVLKSVSNSTFTQGELARYTLQFDTSEYVTVTQGGAPDRILDEMGDGICPVFPTGTAQVAGGAEFTIDGVAQASSAAWNTAIAGLNVDPSCAFPSSSADGASLAGAALASIDFNPTTGRFTTGLALDDANNAAIASGPKNAVGDFQVGESVQLTLVVNVQQGAYPQVTNTVTVDSAAEKTPESKLTDSVTVNVGAADPLPVTGADWAALAMLIALLLVLGGTAAVLHGRRRAALARA